MNGTEVNDLYFTDCVLPDSAVIGEVDQGWKRLMADLATEIECARLMVFDVAQSADEPGRSPNLSRASSMAKLKATEVSKAMSIEGMQMMGGYGYSTKFDMVQHLRVSLGATIFGGTNEIQREIIGRSLGL